MLKELAISIAKGWYQGILKISVSTKYGSSGDGHWAGWPPSAGLRELQPAAACSKPSAGSPDNCSSPGCSELQGAAGWPGISGGHLQSINCESGPGGRRGERGGGGAQIQGHPPGPGLPPGTGYWQNLLEATEYHSQTFFQSIFNWARVISILKLGWFWFRVESFSVLLS